MNYEIVLNNIQKCFGDKLVFKDANAHFSAGKIHGIIGRNGSGKTVLLKCIAGFIQDYTGCILIGGMDRKRIKIDQMQIGVIIETPGFVSGYSGYQNLKFLADIRHRVSKARISQVMEQVGLDPKSRKHVEKYSMGMRQRLGIAQALMEDPPLLLLDEPMNGLDNSGVKELRTLFKELRDEGKTILLASHNAQDIQELCDTVHEMDGGILTEVK